RSGVGGGRSWVCVFFEAEDGIRDWSVTGVQTCALPISVACIDERSAVSGDGHDARRVDVGERHRLARAAERGAPEPALGREPQRSEERRGGEGGGAGGWGRREKKRRGRRRT